MYTFAFHLNLTQDLQYSLIVAKLNLKTKALSGILFKTKVLAI